MIGVPDFNFGLAENIEIRSWGRFPSGRLEGPISLTLERLCVSRYADFILYAEKKNGQRLA
jgi:hypothetical protein